MDYPDFSKEEASGVFTSVLKLCKELIHIILKKEPSIACQKRLRQRISYKEWILVAADEGEGRTNSKEMGSEDGIIHTVTERRG